MHRQPQYPAGGVDRVTLPALDAQSRQPELKHAAVAIERTVLPHRSTAFGRVEPGRSIAAQRALFDDTGQGSCVPFGREDCGLTRRLAVAAPPDAASAAAIAQACGVATATLLRYEDPPRGMLRWFAVQRTGERRLDAVQAALSCGTGFGSCVTGVVRPPAATPGSPAGAA